ncbi:MAG: DUF4382 domain-containing protein [Brumimicrobium sp.]
MKRCFVLPLLVISAILILTSCNKDEQGKISVKLIDAPADFVEVNVEVNSVWAHYAGNGNQSGEWIELVSNPGIYDLLTLQNGVEAVIVDPASLPVGKITQLRLILGDNNYAIEYQDSTAIQHDLSLSSQQNTGIKIVPNIEIKPNLTANVTLDFDVEKSIVETQEGNYKLKPVIKIANIDYAP